MQLSERSIMKGRVEGKVAIVTGAAHGMGASHALCLAREGADVAVVDICREQPQAGYVMGTQEEFQKVANEIKAMGRRAITVQCDISKADEVSAMVDAVIQEFGRIDILVNNAAIALPVIPLWEVTEAQWDKVMEVNLKGIFLCCKYTLPHMIQRQYGKIINIGSVWGREGGQGAAAYSASKGGVHNLTHALAKDAAKYNINVNAVAPGLIRTPMQKASQDVMAKKLGVDSETLGKQFINMLSIFGREIPAEDVSNAVLFLAGEESRSIDGMVIYVDGGHNAA
jgi:NAD(P)-dependent dehydrogenase (short-subunit alcohol dehydrogenase family)